MDRRLAVWGTIAPAVRGGLRMRLRRNIPAGAVSRVLSSQLPAERTIYLSGPYPKPASQNETRSGQLLGFLFGLAPDGVFRASGITPRAVVSYTTFSPLPAPLPE